MDDHTGFALRVAASHLTQSFARRLQSRQMTPAEWVALRLILDAGTIAPSRLAEAMATSRGGTSKLVDKLAARGFLLRIAGLSDRRGQTLSLTDEGRALALALADLAEQNDEAFFAPLDEEERRILHDLLDRLMRRSGGRAGAEP